jgi:uncharacterized membrane protein
VLVVPFAIYMIDPNHAAQWPNYAGWSKPWIVAIVQILNAVGALTYAHAMRHGKALIVAPLTGLAPVITVLLSLAIYAKMPSLMQGVGFVLAAAAIYLLTE